MAVGKKVVDGASGNSSLGGRLEAGESNRP